MKKKHKYFYAALAVVMLLYGGFVMTHKLVSIQGESMEPTLRDGQLVVAPRLITIERGHIYCFQEPDAGKYAVKRLIGLPGDTVALVNGATYVNGELYMEAPEDNWDNQRWELGPDEYLFLGDHRSVSYDGRHWSRPVHYNEIKCELQYIIYPFGFVGKVV